jgi:DNA modification methylase
MVKVIAQEVNDKFALYNGDCIDVIKGIPDESVGFSIFSPPFSSLFTYSNSERDMGNSSDTDQFQEHFKYLIEELYRVMKPGRSVSFHCMNLPMTISHNGFMGLEDFRGDMIRAFKLGGFIYHSEVCIWKDPLVQATRTKNLTLAHKQISKDSSRCAIGLPDYLVTMRKPGENPDKIEHGRGFEYYVGEMPEPKDAKKDDPRINKYSHKVWQRYTSPVWMDIRQTRTLNFAMASEKEDERHICPLQLDTIERAMLLWSKKGDTVLTPFAGIGSEMYVAIEMERVPVGIELKSSYYKTALKNINNAKIKRKGMGLCND